MGSIKSFEELTFWQEARELNKLLFTEILNNNSIKDYPLKDQVNRSAGSIMDNIAEGFDRNGNKELRQFLAIARGSCGEVRSQLTRAYDRSYISQTSYEILIKKCIDISKMINGFVKYLNSSNFKGSKYMEEPVEIYETKNLEY